ncbi:MAG: hypothetical protein ABSF83_10600 [Nitrososphaerales archaeon]
MDLTLGDVSQGSAHDELLLEMLDHQGLVYRVLDGTGGLAGPFPLVLTTQGSASAARSLCGAAGDVLVAEEVVDLEPSLLLLQGLVEDRRDNFDLVVTNAEEKLLASVKERLFGKRLPLPRKWFWPGMAPAACLFTHDIDWFTYSPFHKQVLRQSSNPFHLLRLALGSLVGRRDYGWNIPEMVRLEQDQGFRATYFFQTDYGSAAAAEMLKKSAHLLRSASFEMGLHGSHSSHNDPAALTAELDSFRRNTGEIPQGLRYHILKFEPPRTWELEHAAGLAYDATFFYNRFFGFRAGTCLPYRPFAGGSRLPILELPTSFMDWTALHKELGSKEQLEAFERTRATVEDHHGVLVANFHNTYMNEATFPAMYRIFASLLKTAKERGYWVATGSECARWWSERAAARVDPRLDEAGAVVCSPSSVDVVVEREGRDPEIIPAAVRFAGLPQGEGAP